MLKIEERFVMTICLPVRHRYAISLGATTDFVGTKEKIEYGFELKEHIDRAIELDPNEPTLYFMKGRWCWGRHLSTYNLSTIVHFRTQPHVKEMTIGDLLFYL